MQKHKLGFDFLARFYIVKWICHYKEWQCHQLASTNANIKDTWNCPNRNSNEPQVSLVIRLTCKAKQLNSQLKWDRCWKHRFTLTRFTIKLHSNNFKEKVYMHSRAHPIWDKMDLHKLFKKSYKQSEVTGFATKINLLIEVLQEIRKTGSNDLVMNLCIRLLFC